jgi:hypothetical protein
MNVGIAAIADIRHGDPFDAMQYDFGACNFTLLDVRLNAMGPIPIEGEPISAYRLRYSGYCLKWLLGLGLPFIFILTDRPWSNEGSGQFIVFFLYIGLGLGSLTALTAMLGFFTGAMWSGLLEASPDRAKAWHRFKCYLIAVVAAGMAVFATYWVLQGALNGEVLAISRKGKTVLCAEHEIAFLFAMGFWVWIMLASLHYAWRKRKEANAI